MAKRDRTYLTSQASKNAASGSPTGIYDTLAQQTTFQDTLTEAQLETQERADRERTRIANQKKHCILRLN